MSNQRERRVLVSKLELRAAGEGEARVMTGYGAVFNSATDIGGWWTEVIAPGAFTRSLQENDVVALHSHDMGRVIGRSSAGTLRLSEDDRGLKVECDLPDTSDGRDLAVSIERGDITGMSFGFMTRKCEWDETVEPPKRTLIDVELYEVTATAFPAYEDTELAVRSARPIAEERERTRQRPTSRNLAARRARQAQIDRGI